MARAFKKGRGMISAKDVLMGIKQVVPGMIIGWEKGNTIFGHIGFVKHWNVDNGETIEGNTSSSKKGSQSDGDGIYVRNRSIQPANYFRICWFVPVGY